MSVSVTSRGSSSGRAALAQERPAHVAAALRFTAGDAWFFVVAALACGAAYATAVTSDGPHMDGGLTVTCVDLVFGGAIAASAAVGCFELIALLSGRGRPFPLAATALPAARWLLAVAAGLAIPLVRGVRAQPCFPWTQPFPAWALERDPLAMAALAGLAALLASRVARAAGTGLLIPLAVGASAARGLAELSAFEAGTDLAIPAVSELLNAVVPIAGALAALRFLRPEDARRLGITAWAKDDLALAPLALVYGGAAVFEMFRATPPRLVPYLVADDVRDAPYLGLPAMVFACGAILTLARWAREADARRLAPVRRMG